MWRLLPKTLTHYTLQPWTSLCLELPYLRMATASSSSRLLTLNQLLLVTWAWQTTLYTLYGLTVKLMRSTLWSLLCCALTSLQLMQLASHTQVSQKRSGLVTKRDSSMYWTLRILRLCKRLKSIPWMWLCSQLLQMAPRLFRVMATDTRLSGTLAQERRSKISASWKTRFFRLDSMMMDQRLCPPQLILPTVSSM